MPAPVSDEEAVVAGRGWLLQCPTTGIPEKHPCDLRAQFVLDLSTLRPFCGPFGVIGTLELMVPCRFPDQFVYRRRGVVRRQMILAHHALIGVQFESRAQFEPCDTVSVDR